MRLRVDAKLPPGLARWLSITGHTCVHVNDLGLAAATNDGIGTRARNARAVIWSKDAHFAYRALGRPRPQVVWLRLGNTTNAALQARLAPHLHEIETALAEGEVLIEIR